MGTITAKDGTRIYYKDWGKGPVVTFSHGWPLNSDAWDGQMLFLVQNGYRVVAHDRRGHGRSDQTASGNDMNGYADDLAAVIETLDLRDATLVGHSTGGGEVTRYIGRYGTQRVAKAVLIAAVPPLMLKTEANPEGLPREVFMSVEDNLRQMKVLDDAWNARDWETFNRCHAEETDVTWPGRKDPTHGRTNHRLESIEFIKSVDNHVDNNPYKIQFGQGDWTCTVVRWQGKMVGPMKSPDGRIVPSTGKTFDLEFCTLARWKDGEIVEEKLLYDQFSFLRQIGVI